jgi:hypothetical protein
MADQKQPECGIPKPSLDHPVKTISSRKQPSQRALGRQARLGKKGFHDLKMDDLLPELPAGIQKVIHDF